jgi:hypothetical protein
LKQIRKTKLERYGSETYVNSEKAKQTCLKKYGVDNANKSADVVGRIKQSNFKKYGVEWTWQANDVKKKIADTIKEKYGVANISQLDMVKNKKKASSILKFNVDNPSKSPDIVEKIKSTNIEKYGDVCPLKNDKIKNKAYESSRKTYYRKIKNRLGNMVELLFDETLYLSTDKKYKYKFRCHQCKQEFEDHMDGGRIPRCMICYPYLNGVSAGEKYVMDYIKTIMPSESIRDKCWDLLGNKEVDIYIPSKNIAIEYNGLYWHSELGGRKNRLYHYNKYAECKRAGVRLIQIFEDEWLNKNDIVKHRLSGILGEPSETIYARRCDIKEIDSSVSTAFIDKYHIQGNIPASHRIGLFYKNELVAVMTFSSLRIVCGGKAGDGQYELLRMVSSKPVVGGASRMLSFFIKQYAPKVITSYSDLRWNTGDVYEKIGMTKVSTTPPNYWYFIPGYAIRYHRFSFRKNILPEKLSKFDPELTEWENMQINGYDRIWDCGNNKYEWRG